MQCHNVYLYRYLSLFKIEVKRLFLIEMLVGDAYEIRARQVLFLLVPAHEIFK